MGINDIDGRAMGVGAVDYDDDGFTDIYVANDHTMNYLWHNNGGKGFTDMGNLPEQLSARPENPLSAWQSILPIIMVTD